jgi:hypothetical protein
VNFVCSENPLWAGVQPTKIATESGTIFPKMPNLSAANNSNQFGRKKKGTDCSIPFNSWIFK